MEDNKEEMRMQNDDKNLEKQTEPEAGAQPKKKNIIQVFRPQNSKTGMVKPGHRPGARPQGARPQGTRPQGARPQGARPQGARPQGAKPQAAKPVQAPQTEEKVVAAQAPEQTAPVKPAVQEVQPAPVQQAAPVQKPAPEKPAPAAEKAPAAEPEKVQEKPAAKEQEKPADAPARRDERPQGRYNNDGQPRRYNNNGQGGQGRYNNDGQRRYNNDGQGGQGRYNNDGQRRYNNDGQGGQGRYNNDGQRRYNNDGQGGQGRYNNDGQRRFNNDGQGGQGRYNNNGQGGQNRYNNNDGQRRFNNDNRGRFNNEGDDRFNKDEGTETKRFGNQGRGGSGMSKGPVEAKPLEKESRKRTERGDRNRTNKGDKLDRMEKDVRQNQKNNKKSQPAKPQPPKPVEKPEDTIKNITIPEKLTISELAEVMKIQPSVIVKKLFLQGTMVTVNQEIDFDKAEEIALEFNYICEKEEKVDVLEELLKDEEDSEETLVPRSPVVCVMGHVDHGKTSLLDAIRDTHVIDKEAGGITQHIGAYVVSINGQKITFLDTPGHEAFTAMRMRGANSTDIAILVVAADDGVMPQTIEAINHAKAAGIEIIVAINKIDKPSANIERVKQELTEYGLIAEDWGGSTVMVPVSAHTQEGIDNLLEMILLTSEVLELKANPKRKARGIVIEAELDKGKGPVATILVQKGTLRVGEPVAVGPCYGKVRAMMDDKGRRVKEAGPSTPVEILGLSDVPNAGEIFMSMDNEKEARSFAETFISEGRERLLEDTKLRMSLDDLYSQIQAGSLKELALIIKADVQGSVEAVKQSLLKLSNDEVVVKVIHGGVGAINESDVILASASKAIIIGFNVRPDVMAKATADREGVDIRLYRVIYDAINDVEAAMKGMLDPIFEEKVIGHAEVRQTFKASGVGTIAGSYVTDGIFQRGCSVRIIREGAVIHEGVLASLKRFKDDVKEVKTGFECGLVVEKFNDIKEEDHVEAFIMVEVPR